jgi:hypothetical protein
MSAETEPLLCIAMDGHPPSANAVLRSGVKRRIRDKKYWQLYAWSEAAQRWRRPPLGRARLRIRYVRKGGRPLDPDNVFPKYIIDGIRAAHVIVDDSPEYVALDVVQELGPGRRVVVEVYPWDVGDG